MRPPRKLDCGQGSHDSERLATETESRMGLWKWWKSRGAGGDDSMLGEWRLAWQEACASPDAAHVAALSARLNELGLPDDDVEMEREMLEGLEQLARLQALVAVNGLPSLETGHRVVGSDACHFSAPSSMPEESSQPSGRLILTSARAVFVGGAKATTVPWHAVSDVLQQQRDVVLVRSCSIGFDATCLPTPCAPHFSHARLHAARAAARRHSAKLVSYLRNVRRPSATIRLCHHLPQPWHANS